MENIKRYNFPVPAREHELVKAISYIENTRLKYFIMTAIKEKIERISKTDSQAAELAKEYLKVAPDRK